MKNGFIYDDTIPLDSTIALGDVHGQYSLLTQFVDWVKGSGARVIMLGDLIDRSRNPGDDLRVLELVRDLTYDPEGWGLASFTALRGNHETMFLNALEGLGVQDWVYNGGDWENWKELSKHAGWIERLPYYVTVGDTLFSHAGCFPGEDPALSMNTLTKREAFVWNRGSFLRDGPKLEAWSKTLKKVVFGHTPESALPYRIPDGICIDTWAFRSGTLTAYNSTYNTFNQFELSA
jgi:hypothetical protein